MISSRYLVGTPASPYGHRATVLRSLFLGLCLSWGSGCSEKPAPVEETLTEAPTQAPAVQPDHQFVPAKQRTKELGERCASGGESECLSRLCLRAGPRLDADYFCSQQCSSENDCPKTWGCIQIHPSAGGQVCVPPKGWTGAVAEPR